MEQIRPYLDYFSAHPSLAIVIVFLIAFGEALLIIGLFVPSTVVLVGAGMLIGTGHLGFWPVFIATCVGAIGGDQVSYWAGRWYGDRLKAMWPLSRYPQLVIRGEDYVRQHGGKSIAIGRFVPGIKAVVPGIVGMLNMNQAYFVMVNFTSGIAWSALHIVPGILLGQGLALAGEVSDRLLILLVGLIAFLAITGWIVRLAAGSLSPHVDRLLVQLAAWAMRRRSRPMHRLGLALRPGRPKAKLILLSGFLCLGALVVLADMVSGLMLRTVFSNFDLSVHNLMSQLRNSPGDDLMIPITMMGDTITLSVGGAAIVLWLVWRKSWRAAFAAATTLTLARLSSTALKFIIQRPRPPTEAAYPLLDSYSFPSSHAVMAGTFFGIIAVLAGHTMGRWSRAVVISTCSIAAMTIAFSRIYLGVHWFSDVLGGLLIALVFVTIFGIIMEAVPARRLRPFGLLATAGATLAIFGFVHITSGLDLQIKRYTAPNVTSVYSAHDWTGGKWETLPNRRIDLAGTPEEKFTAQWVGSLDSLESYGKLHGWTLLPTWKWHDSLAYLNDKATLDSIPPRPLLHEGLKAKLTAIVNVNPTSRTRIVLRAYQTRAAVDEGGRNAPVFLVSVTEERLRISQHLFAFPVQTFLQPDRFQDVFADVVNSLAGTAIYRNGSPADNVPVIVTGNNS